MLVRSSLVAALSLSPMVLGSSVLGPVLGSAVAAQEADAALPDGFEVLERWIEATGGEKAHRAIKSTKLSGTFSMPAQGIEGGVTIMRAAPNKMRILIDLGGMGKVDQGTDGKDAWMAQPGAPMQMLQGDPKEAMIANADFYRALKPRDRYTTAENTGVKDVDGEKAYAIKLVDSTGTESVEYYSVETGLRLKEEGEEQSVTYGDYKEHKGIMLPMKMQIVMQTPFGEMAQSLTFEKVEQNFEPASGDFDAPGAM